MTQPAQTLFTNFLVFTNQEKLQFLKEVSVFIQKPEAEQLLDEQAARSSANVCPLCGKS